MTLLTPIALLGLLLLPGLVALHLHRRRARAVEISSLLLWENLVGEPAQGGKRWRLDYILLLVLQILAVCVLVLSLARPANTTTSAGSQVYVVDRGALMTAADPAPSRYDAARSRVDGEIRAASAGTTVTVILADAQPSVLVSTTDHALATRLLARVTPVEAMPDLGQAIRLAGGFLGSAGHMEVLYAKGETLPQLSAHSGVWSATSIGGNTDDQAISGLNVRCVTGATSCDALATLRNDADSAVQEDIVINADGTVLGRQSVRLPAHSDTDLSFAVSSARHVVELYLTRSDLVPVDNLAWSIIPSLGATTVTIVGDAAHTAPIVRAFKAIPSAHTVVLTPNQYKSVASGVPGLLVLAGWMPSGDLPATPSLLLVDPPRFPGAPPPDVLTDTGVGNEDTTSALLAGVDLTSLDIPYGAGEALVLPQELHSVVSSARSPLITAGVLGGRRVATIDFSLTASNLTQLDAFPILMANILQWSSNWLPSTISPGRQLTIDIPPATSSITMARSVSLNSPKTTQALQAAGADILATIPAPGLYAVTEHGTWGERSGQVAANVSSGTLEGLGGPIVVSRSVGPSGDLEAATLRSVWWPWLGLIAALAMMVEWLVATAGFERRG